MPTPQQPPTTPRRHPDQPPADPRPDPLGPPPAVPPPPVRNDPDHDDDDNRDRSSAVGAIRHHAAWFSPQSKTAWECD